MSQQPNNQSNANPPRPGRPGRALAVWIILLLALMGFWQLAMQRKGGEQEMAFNPDFLQKVGSGEVVSAVLHPESGNGAGVVTGKLKGIDANGNEQEFRVVAQITPELTKVLTDAGVPFKFEAPNTLLWSLLGQGASLLLFFLLFYFLFYRRMGAGGPGGGHEGSRHRYPIGHPCRAGP